MLMYYFHRREDIGPQIPGQQQQHQQQQNLYSHGMPPPSAFSAPQYYTPEQQAYQPPPMYMNNIPPPMNGPLPPMAGPPVGRRMNDTEGEVTGGPEKKARLDPEPEWQAPQVVSGSSMFHSLISN